MKFREYVGERKVKEVKKVVVKPEKEFPKVEAKNEIQTYLGFGLSKKALKRIFDYIKSWFIRYNIPFDPVNPYLTLYLLQNVPHISNLIKEIKPIKRNIIYNPVGTLTVISNNEKEYLKTIDLKVKDGKDYIVLDYIPNLEYNNKIEPIFDKLGIDIIKKFCYVKLFEIKDGVLKRDFYEEMMYCSPPLPNLRLGHVGLIREKNADL